MTYEIGTSKRPDRTFAVAIGAGGMGMAVARRMAQSYRVLIADLDAARVRDAAATLCAEGADATGIACDITDPAAITALGSRVDELRRGRTSCPSTRWWGSADDRPRSGENAVHGSYRCRRG